MKARQRNINPNLQRVVGCYGFPLFCHLQVDIWLVFTLLSGWIEINPSFVKLTQGSLRRRVKSQGSSSLLTCLLLLSTSFLTPSLSSFSFLLFQTCFFLCPHLQLNGALGCSFLHFHPSERQTFLLTSGYRTITQATSWNWYSRQIRLVDPQKLRGRRSHTRINFPDCSVTLWFRLSSDVKPKWFCFGWWLLAIAFHTPFKLASLREVTLSAFSINLCLFIWCVNFL